MKFKDRIKLGVSPSATVTTLDARPADEIPEDENQYTVDNIESYIEYTLTVDNDGDE